MSSTGTSDISFSQAFSFPDVEFFLQNMKNEPDSGPGLETEKNKKKLKPQGSIQNKDKLNMALVQTQVPVVLNIQNKIIWISSYLGHVIIKLSTRMSW